MCFRTLGQNSRDRGPPSDANDRKTCSFHALTEAAGSVRITFHDFRYYKALSTRTFSTEKGYPASMSAHTALASRSTHTATRQHSARQSQRLSARANAAAALRLPCSRPFTAAPAGRQAALICRAEQSATGKGRSSSPPSNAGRNSRVQQNCPHDLLR